EDKKANDEATHNGQRVLSAYELFGQKIWIITEWDRSVTTMLFPHEY
ncbi:type I restriction endonuclease subunit M, partial [Vibrio parahaemolyticus]